MQADPNFAYDVLRPIAVVSSYMLSMRLGWLLRDWMIKRRERKAQQARDVTPARSV